MKSSVKCKSLRSAVLTGSVLALSLSLGTARAQESVPASEAEGGNLWFVELAGLPVADGKTLASVRGEKDKFRRNAAVAGVTYTERRSYDVLFNGFSIEASALNRAKIMRLPGVKAMYPVVVVEAPKPDQTGALPDIARAVDLTGAKIAQTQLGLTGAGIKVGIVDTGIDIDHPSFGGSGTPGTTPFPSARVIAGWDFVGDAYNSSGTTAAELTPVPDPNPDDCAGHGTHVAGITGANGGGFTGVAPGVTFGAYRVFGCTGTTTSDIIVAALERAYADGMQVINQSLGAGRQWPQYPSAQASNRLARKGVVMVASIGNNGPGGSSPDGLFAAGAPGVGDKVIGVASFDNAQAAFEVNGTPYGYNQATGSPNAPTAGSLPLAKTWGGAAPNPSTNPASAPVDDGCAALPAGSMTGMAVLIRRGTCSFYIKASNAQAAGAAAVVLYNNQPGAVNPTVAGAPPITIPVVAITAAQGVALHNLIAAGPTTLEWTANSVGYPYGTGGLISGFSSFGLNAELTLKPQIGAPGGGIFATYPLELGGAATLSGTSMSSPHVAGAAALVMQGLPKLNPRKIETYLQNSADPQNWSGNAALGFLDYTFRQGAGMVDIVGTVQTALVLEPSQISVGESEGGPKTFTIELRNTIRSAVTYDITHVSAVAAGPNNIGTGASYAPTGTFDAPATVTFSVPSITLASRGTGSFDVTIDANAALPNRSLYGGYIVLTPQNGGAPYRVPYGGFKGDYQSTVVLTPTANNFPWLSKLLPCTPPATGLCYFNQPAGATYTLVGNDVPIFLMHLDHLSRRVRLEVFDAVTGRAWHRISNDHYVTRNSTPSGFFTWPWDGGTFTGEGTKATQLYTVPDGQYIVKVSVLKALGDETNPAHVETWTSPVITIDRP